MDERLKRGSGRTVRFFGEIAAAAVVGIGVPVFWIWVGSRIQGSRGTQHVEATTAVILVVGILLSYTLILIVAGAIQARSETSEGGPPPRHPWNRSARDEPYRPGTGRLTPVEAVFVGTAIVASIAMLVWFFAFAGSPLPS